MGKADILSFERIRLELLGLMKFAVSDSPQVIYTDLRMWKQGKLRPKNLKLTMI